MKAVILAGGRGSRLGPETESKPKPLVEVGGKPIIWHIMQIYNHYGINSFVVLLGYKGWMIKEYFANYQLRSKDCVVAPDGSVHYLQPNDFPGAAITFLDTGEDSNTAHRVLYAKSFINEKSFALTYGDGVSDVDILKMLMTHKENLMKPKLTLTAVKAGNRFGVLDINQNTGEINKFVEKPERDDSWINGGFMICDYSVFDYIEAEKNMPLEDVIHGLVRDRAAFAHKHEGFWGCMDTPRDRENLEKLWASGAPWKVWK